MRINGLTYIFALNKNFSTTMTQSCIHTTPPMGGKVKKVMSLRTSDEERRARIREKQIRRMQAKKRAMIQAVEQAVALPAPSPKPITREEVVTEAASQPIVTPQQQQKKSFGTMLGSINSILDRWKNFVLEE